MNSMIKFFMVLCWVALGFSATAQTSSYPSQPVKLMVTFTPGGAADLTARIIGEHLSRKWNQQVVVDNKIGAGGSIGVEQVFRAKPDGYTLLLASNTHAINQALYNNLPFDLRKDFIAIASLTSSPIALAVNPKVSVKNLKEFTALLRSQPGNFPREPCC
jgi:tripartite-type tricarboxylate transporter receptor subunit TctC